MYAAGYAPDEIEEIFAQVDQARLYGRSAEEKPSLLGLAGVLIFFWAVRNGQYEDMEGPAHRILNDDDMDRMGTQESGDHDKTT